MENGHSAIMENGHNDNNVENGHNANVENGHNANLENGHTANIQNGHQEPGPMLCLSMCAYRKEGMDEEEYRKYMTENHAPLVRGLMVKYGIDKYSMTHNPLSTRSLMKKIYDEQFSNIADYDCIVQIQFRDVEQFIAMKNDPVYKSTIFADHKKFADTTRSKMTIGWVRDIVRDGAIV